MKSPNDGKLTDILNYYFAFIVLIASSPLTAQTKETKSQMVLKQEINFILKRSDTPRTIKAIDVYSRKNRKVLFDYNSGFLFNPASNLKIVTTSFALQNLGINYRFKTRFIISGVRHADTIDGDLVVATCGDPLIMHTDLDSVAGIISNSGIRTINGDLVIDVSRFDSLEWGSGWMWDDEPSQYQMFISPACLDHNTIEAILSLDSNHILTAATQPVTNFVRIISTAVPDTVDSLTVIRVMADDTNAIRISGEYSSHLHHTDYCFSVRHPARYFGTVFKEMLDKHGIKVRGDVLTELASSSQTREKRRPGTGTKGDTLFTLDHQIDTVVTYVNKESDNLGAECLLRVVPNEVHNEVGSAANGIKFEEVFLNQCGVDSTEYQVADGSGLSRYDLITPKAIVKVLDRDLDQPFGNLFFHSLPVGGRDGTLEKRMSPEFLIGNVIAKTGTINGASTLSGFVVLPGDTLIFSMMMQNYLTSVDSIHAVQDSICSVLALYSDKSWTFKKNLRKNDVGTYWELNRRRESRRQEINRIKKRRPRVNLHENTLMKH
jgi:PBP4 family serine-type D-alanyl-D-alanine carboxypeptidase